jgi:hypothetical protein
LQTVSRLKRCSRAALQAQREAKASQRPKILPHPAAIARYVTELAQTIEEGDVGRVGALRRSVLTPFRMIPEGVQGHRLAGALDLVKYPMKVVAGA